MKIHIALTALALMLISVLSQAGSDPGTSMVRVVNDSGVPVKNIRLNGVSFGDLSVGGISRYKPLSTAYPYASLRVEVANKAYEWMPTDHFGEKPLGKGIFTYGIRRENTVAGPEFIAKLREKFVTGSAQK
jgi:hypothetical protein